MNKRTELINELINIYNCESNRELVKSKNYKYSDNISRERFDIVNNEQAKFYNKDIGRYELFSIPNPMEISTEEISLIESQLSNVLKSLFGKISSRSKILIVGLGNRHISADSLGTAICSNINITIDSKHFPQIMAICPSVMGLTGIETYDIVSGVIEKVKPTHLILIDSLCASDESRLCKSIQITNTGVCPGSGIGNNRKCIDNSLAPCVISIGVPLLIYSNTFILSALEKNNINFSKLNSIMQNAKKSPENIEFINIVNDLLSVINSPRSDVIVSIKDIEECVEILATIISSAINSSLGVSELKQY